MFVRRLTLLLKMILADWLTEFSNGVLRRTGLEVAISHSSRSDLVSARFPLANTKGNELAGAREPL